MQYLHSKLLANLLFEKIAQSLVLTLPKFNVHHSLDNYIPKRVNKLLFLVPIFRLKALISWHE